MWERVITNPRTALRPPWTVDAAFTPALDPSAAGLALEFPNPFGNGVIHATVDLPPVGDPGQPR
jgi:hypothetical protein